MYQLLIEHDGNLLFPSVEGDVDWQTSRKGKPGTLKFNVIKDDLLNFTEGDAVSFIDDDKKVFFGFVFTKTRTKENIISVTAYDQLRYLKNKDTYVYDNKSASELLQMISADFNLQTGEIDDTGFKIESRVEDNQSLFDIIQNALDLTLQSTKTMFVMFDDCGKIALKNIANMKVNYLISADNAEDYNYSSSIDGETYDKIKLSYENKETGKREIYIAQDGSNINKWGILQFFESIDEKTNGQAKADALLDLYNHKTRKLSVEGVKGDSSVHAGVLVPVSLNLGDIVLNSFLLVEECKHKYSESQHTMDLILRGGEFVV